MKQEKMKKMVKWFNLLLGIDLEEINKTKGVGRKKFQGGGEGQRKKRPKNNKKRQKNNTIKPLPGGGGATEKRPKNSKKARKNCTLSIICNMYKIQGGHGPPADAHK